MNASSPIHHPAAEPERPSSRLRVRLVAAAATAGLIVAATAIDPDIDLAVARSVMLPAMSPARPAVAILREIFRFSPYVLFLVVLAVIWRRAATGRMPRRAAIRAAFYLAATLAVGPGLAVNAGLKSFSQRPRPLQTAEVAGTGSPFRPFYRFDGACVRNCSFSSGEAASSFWTVAPALLAPPPYRGMAVAAALGFGVLVSTLRMVIGAHYLSDVAFSALLILSLVLLVRRLVMHA